MPDIIFCRIEANMHEGNLVLFDNRTRIPCTDKMQICVSNAALTGKSIGNMDTNHDSLSEKRMLPAVRRVDGCGCFKQLPGCGDM